MSIKILFSNKAFRSKILAMAIGNMMEFFDFASFGALADVIAYQFFPNEDTNIQFLKSLSVFGAAFVMRPIGGLLVGRIGDLYGRKKALELSILCMLIPSLLIGCLPTYNQFGYTVTALLVSFRLIQGLACGGELVGAYIYTIESINNSNPGFWGGICKGSANFGTSIGIALVAILRISLTHEQLFNWGWRIPFLSSAVFGVIGYKLRSLITNEEYEENQDSELNDHKYNQIGYSNANNQKVDNSIWFVIKTYYLEILVVILVISYWCCGYYSIFIWLVYFMSNDTLIGQPIIPDVWIINVCMNILLVVMLPISGHISDLYNNYYTKHYSNNNSTDLSVRYHSYHLMMQLSLILSIFISIPSFSLICTRTIIGAIIGQGLFVLTIGLFGSNIPIFLCSQFDSLKIRYTAIGLAYNISQAIFSGTAPIIQTALVESYHRYHNNNIIGLDNIQVSSFRLTHDSRLYPSYYIMFISLISLSALHFGVPYCEKRRMNRLNDISDITIHSTNDLIPNYPTAPVVEYLDTYDDNMDSNINTNVYLSHIHSPVKISSNNNFTNIYIDLNDNLRNRSITM